MIIEQSKLDAVIEKYPNGNIPSCEVFGTQPLSFGKVLRSVRHLIGFSQTETAKQLGISKQLLSAYETDKQLPSITNVVEMARLFEYPITFLLEARTRWEFKKAGFDITVELKQAC